MTGVYNPLLVCLSLVVPFLASYRHARDADVAGH